jgi:hypothetical protein
VGGDRQIKKPKAAGKGRFLSPVVPASTNRETPVFCLRHLIKPYTLAECTDSEAQAFAKRLYEMCQLDWNTIQSTRREGQGHERMPVGQLPPLPARVTPDVEELIVFRFGDRARILGLRHDRVFEVYLIDPKGSAYNH